MFTMYAECQTLLGWVRPSLNQAVGCPRNSWRCVGRQKYCLKVIAVVNSTWCKAITVHVDLAPTKGNRVAFDGDGCSVVSAFLCCSCAICKECVYGDGLSARSPHVQTQPLDGFRQNVTWTSCYWRAVRTLQFPDVKEKRLFRCMQWRRTANWR